MSCRLSNLTNASFHLTLRRVIFPLTGNDKKEQSQGKSIFLNLAHFKTARATLFHWSHHWGIKDQQWQQHNLYFPTTHSREGKHFDMAVKMPTFKIPLSDLYYVLAHPQPFQKQSQQVILITNGILSLFPWEIP